MNEIMLESVSGRPVTLTLGPPHETPDGQEIRAATPILVIATRSDVHVVGGSVSLIVPSGTCHTFKAYQTGPDSFEWRQ